MDAYFTVESISPQNRVTFQELKTRLIRVVNARVLNGEFTERGLARILGVSQPQIHNVLKGARNLGTDLADRLLGRLGITVADLFQEEELEEQSKRRQRSAYGSSIPDLQLPFGVGDGAPKKPPTPELGLPNRNQSGGFLTRKSQ